MSIKTFFLKQMMKMKGLPEDQVEMILKMYERDPELFKKITIEIEQKKKDGKSEMAAAMEVMRKYQGDIRKLMS